MKCVYTILLFLSSQVLATNIHLSSLPNIVYDGTGLSGIDTIYINHQSTPYGVIQLSNVNGTPGHHIVICNYGGPVIAGGSSSEATFEMFTCTNVNVEGTGSSDYYGFQLGHSAVNGFEAHFGSTSVSLNRVKVDIGNIGYAGVVIRTYPSEGSSWTKSAGWHLDSTIIHKCFITNTNGEGIYSGVSHYGDKDTLSFNPVSDWGGNEAASRWTRVYDDTLTNIGWDGIQVSACIIGMYIVNNFVDNYATASRDGDDGGITVNPGSSGIVDRNWCRCYTGSFSMGIMFQGQGNTYLTNNILIGGQTGIAFLRNTVFNVNGSPDTIVYAYNNNMVKGTDGYWWYGDNFPRNRVYFYNQIVAGNTSIYSIGNGLITYMNKQTNFETASTTTPGFVNYAGNDFHLAIGSPCITTGTNELAAVPLDFYGSARTVTFDIGAVRFSTSTCVGCIFRRRLTIVHH